MSAHGTSGYGTARRGKFWHVQIWQGTAQPGTASLWHDPCLARHGTAYPAWYVCQVWAHRAVWHRHATVIALSSYFTESVTNFTNKSHGYIRAINKWTGMIHLATVKCGTCKNIHISLTLLLVHLSPLVVPTHIYLVLSALCM